MSDFVARQRVSAHVLFSYGFRPFFLGAGVYALVVMGIWIAWLSMQMPGWAMFGSSPFAWHAHEMIFGFAAAALAGFLLTAVPNWNCASPLSGPPLMLLFAVWLLGRMAMLAAGLLGPVTVAVLDLAFLPHLASPPASFSSSQRPGTSCCSPFSQRWRERTSPITWSAAEFGRAGVWRPPVCFDGARAHDRHHRRARHSGLYAQLVASEQCVGADAATPHVVDAAAVASVALVAMLSLSPRHNGYRAASRSSRRWPMPSGSSSGAGAQLGVLRSFSFYMSATVGSSSACF